MFCKNIITFSSNADYVTKVNISEKITFFYPNLAFFNKIDTEKYTCYFAPTCAQYVFITVFYIHSFAPKLMYFA